MFRTLAYYLCFLAFAAFPAAAETLAMPKGQVLLTVSGNITTTNDAGTAVLDLEMLQALETRKIETTTIWTEGTQVFEGVRLKTLVDALGLEGTTLRATAINDYAVDIPFADATQDGPIVAYLLNGKEMSVRDKGPLWIVYPYDENADFRTEVIYSRSIWQMTRIEAID